MCRANMKIFMLFCVTVNFLNPLRPSTATDNCLKTKLSKDKPLEIGILYDLTGKVTDLPPKALKKLDGIVCAITKASGGIVTLKRKPGAKVTTESNGGIKCADDCVRIRNDACKGYIVPAYFTNCDGAPVLMKELNKCLATKQSDHILKENAELKNRLGISDSKLPALTFNDEYEPCTEFSTKEILQKFVCSIYDNAIPGCRVREND